MVSLVECVDSEHGGGGGGGGYEVKADYFVVLNYSKINELH